MPDRHNPLKIFHNRLMALNGSGIRGFGVITQLLALDDGQGLALAH
jgi:hypothetical protein